MNSVKINANVIDEMFPDGSGNVMMELDEVFKNVDILFYLEYFFFI